MPKIKTTSLKPLKLLKVNSLEPEPEGTISCFQRDIEMIAELCIKHNTSQAIIVRSLIASADDLESIIKFYGYKKPE